MYTMQKILFILFGPLFFTSCISFSTISIQVLEPASDPLTTAVGSTALLNRSIFDPLIYRVPEDERILDSVLVTSYNLATTEVLFSLADILNESPRFAFIDNDKLLEMPVTDKTKEKEILEPSFVNYLCDSLQVDGIISLENYYVEYNDTLIKVPGESGTQWMDYYIGRTEVLIDGKWRAYIRSEDSPVEEFRIKDTLSWEYSAFSAEETLINLPAAEEALIEASYFTALTYARRIAPYWLEKERYYYSTGNRLLRQASVYLLSDQLQNAETVYETLIGRNNKNTIAAASLNLALINELRGDFRQALVLARKSFRLKRHPLTAGYIEILENRLEKSRELDEQLGINP